MLEAKDHKTAGPQEAVCYTAYSSMSAFQQDRTILQKC